MFSCVRNCQTVSQMAMPLFIPTRSKWKFLMFYILTSNWCYQFLDYNHSNRLVVVSHCLICMSLMMCWKTPWCWEGLGAGGKGDNRGWDGWMASLTRWTWVWVNSGSLWWTGKPGVLWFTGFKKSDTTEQLNWTELNDVWHGTSFHILICHLYFFFGELSAKVFGPLKNWVLSFIVEF